MGAGLLLYTPSESLGNATTGVVADVTRRQRVRQLTHEILQACTSAGSPFSWLRIQGFERLAAAVEAGVAADCSALGSSLDETYSQVLEVVLSSLDRQLVIPPDQLCAPGGADGGAPGAAGAGAARARLQQQLAHHQRELSAAAPQIAGGLAPAHAGPGEWAAAARALAGVVILHAKTRAVLATAQYLQLLASRACSCPPCAPPMLDALLAVTAGSAEAQALFAGTGGLDAAARLARGAAEAPGARRPGGGGGGGGGGPVAAVPRDVRLRCLGFLHVFMGHVLSRSVRAGQVHPNTQRSAQQLLHTELGQAAADTLLKTPADATLAAASQAAAPGSGGGGSGGLAAVAAVAEAALAAVVAAGRAVDDGW
ncbi:MAG: hypothetical protein J3K34DRAFT_518992 [Monoraphidium minutum]|nr:MAG: hypothetical protein J3K34DRAFT_518992 [Monoraphidium minutum]